MMLGPDQIWVDYQLVYNETDHYRFTGRVSFVFDSDTVLIPKAKRVE